VWNQTINQGDPVILDGLIEDVKRIQSTPAEMDYINSGREIKSRIMQVFGVNPIVLGEIESANRASSLAAEEHLASTINPKLRLIGDTITEWLCPRFESRGRLAFWFEPYSANDQEMKLRWAQALGGLGAITPDELRALSPLGLGPMMGGLGALPVQPPQTLEEALDRSIQIQTMAAWGEHARVDASHRSRQNGRAKAGAT
jgi:phage portal protein BeeE